MSDTKKFSFDFPETLAERKIDKRECVIDERVGVGTIGHGDGGECVGIFCRILDEKTQCHCRDGAAAGFGKPRMALKDVLKPFFGEHFQTLAQTE